MSVEVSHPSLPRRPHRAPERDPRLGRPVRADRLAHHDGAFDIPNFELKDGGILRVLHLHYLTLGVAHRDAAGHVDNAVLLLHGTGGDAHSLLNPVFSDVLFGPASPSTSRNST